MSDFMYTFPYNAKAVREICPDLPQPSVQVNSNTADTAQIEVSPAERPHLQDDLIVFNGILYTVISQISVGDILIVGSNIATSYPSSAHDPAEDGVIALETTWTDTPSLYMVSNNPEVGPPIRRLRSTNVKHTIPISFIIDNFWYNKLWLAFIRALHGGIEPFLFPEITYNKIADGGASDVHEVVAHFSMENGTAFTVKRHDKYTYLVSATVIWTEEDGINAH